MSPLSMVSHLSLLLKDYHLAKHTSTTCAELHNVRKGAVIDINARSLALTHEMTEYMKGT